MCAGGRKREERQIRAVLSNSASYYLQKGSAAINEKRYSEALRWYRQAIQLTPYDPVAHNDVGVAFYHLGQIDSAIFYFQAAIRLRPDYGQAFVNLSKAYLLLEKFPQAHAAAEKALLYHGQKSLVFALIAEIYEKQANWQAAISASRKAVEHDPANIDLRVNLGTLLFRSGKVHLAIEEYQKALQQDSTHAIAYFNLGNALARNCLLQEAMAQYQQAIKYQPSLVAARNNQGLILLFLREPFRAVEEFRRALAIDPQAFMVMYNLSIALAEMDSLPQALAIIQKAVELQPETAHFHLQLGRILEKMGKKEAAIAAFHQALALDSTLASGYNALANTLVENDLLQAQIAYRQALVLFPEYLQRRYHQNLVDLEGGFIDLLANCQSAAQISIDYAMIYNNLGKVQLRLKQWSEALQSFGRAIDIRPDIWEPYENMAIIFFAQNNQQRAREMLAKARVNRARIAIERDSLAIAQRLCQEAISQYPGYAAAYALLAEVYSKQHMRKQAKQALDRGLQIDKNDFELNYVYGKFLAADSRYAEAEKYLRRAVELNPASQEAQRKLADVLFSLGKEADATIHLAAAHAALAREYEKAGFIDRAMEEFQNASRLDPNNIDYLSAQALLSIRRHTHTEADSLLNLLLEKNPNNAQALYGKGVLAGDQKKYEEAVFYLQKALQQKPDDGAAHYALAVNYYFLNQLDLAKYHAEKAKQAGILLRESFIQALGGEKSNVGKERP